MYQLSKDYEKLFELICAGNVAVGFVDYKCKADVDVVLRDVCQIRRDRPFNINGYVRGATYFYVYEFDQKKGLPEQDIFCERCRAANLEWIQPSA